MTFCASTITMLDLRDNILYRLDEVLEGINLSRMGVYKFTSTGRLKAKKLAGKLYFFSQDIRAWAENGAPTRVKEAVGIPVDKRFTIEADKELDDICPL